MCDHKGGPHLALGSEGLERPLGHGLRDAFLCQCVDKVADGERPVELVEVPGSSRAAAGQSKGARRWVQIRIPYRITGSCTAGSLRQQSSA